MLDSFLIFKNIAARTVQFDVIAYNTRLTSFLLVLSQHGTAWDPVFQLSEYNPVLSCRLSFFLYESRDSEAFQELYSFFTYVNLSDRTQKLNNGMPFSVGVFCLSSSTLSTPLLTFLLIVIPASVTCVRSHWGSHGAASR